MTTVVVAGALANKHRHGGSAWVRMSWVDALRSLGFDAVFVEQIAAADCVDSAGTPAPLERSANLEAFRSATEAFGLAGRAALVRADDGRVVGMPRDELCALLDGAVALVNISGHLRLPELVCRVRGPHVFVDLDPGYTQIWDASGADTGNLRGHDLHFSVGANVGGAGWTLPTGGVRWRAIRQPVVLERWNVEPDDGFTGFTTVASWRGAFGPAEWKGRSYGVKAHQFRGYAELPALVRAPFAIALDIDRADVADRERLDAGGWTIVDPSTMCGIDGFRRFVERSGAEFSAAQGVYVETRSGWFSDRTVRYLAAGRPALVQDTGFSEHLPVGAGLLAFSDLEQACAGARAIAGDYAHHRAAARELAEAWFSPGAALAPLLEQIGAPS
ncbi:MAG TPA: hypothetical protein VFB41_05530 [Solirubrobacteraceae bacterium]|nr:hypothetical protein [Solirubrobacteraceae bacterium]